MDLGRAQSHLGEERQRLRSLRDGSLDEAMAGETEEESLSELSKTGQHQAELGAETLETEQKLSVLEQVEAELADVEHALHRLDEGTYGTCEACGRPIDEARLEVRPEARLCRADQEAADRGARGRA